MWGLALSCALAAPSHADWKSSGTTDSDVVLQSGERYFLLQQEIRMWGFGNRLVWKEMSLAEIKTQAGAAGQYSFPRGEIEVDAFRKKVRVKEANSDSWVELLSIAPGDNRYSVLAAMIDSKGNSIIRFDGDTSELHANYYFSPPGSTEPPLPLNFDHSYLKQGNGIASRLPNPYGSGIITLSLKGDIWMHSIPSRKMQKSFRKLHEVELQFKSEPLIQGMSIKSIAPAFGKLVMSVGNRLAILNSSKGIEALGSPAGINPGTPLVIRTLRDFKPLEPVPSWEATPGRRRIEPGSIDPKTALEMELLPASATGDGRSPELERISKLAEQYKAELREEVIDQHRYTDALVDAWRDHKIRGKGHKKPLVIFVTGPPGAGKTFGAVAFAKRVLKDEKKFLEIDGTHYAHKGSLDHHRLIGASRTEGQRSSKDCCPEFCRKAEQEETSSSSTSSKKPTSPTAQSADGSPFLGYLKQAMASAIRWVIRSSSSPRTKAPIKSIRDRKTALKRAEADRRLDKRPMRAQSISAAA